MTRFFVFRKGATLPTAATPFFSLSSGTYSGTQPLTLSDSTPGSTIYYTLDGSTPTPASAVYSTTLFISGSQTVKAIATAAGYSQSAVGSNTYVITAGASAQKLFPQGVFGLSINVNSWTAPGSGGPTGANGKIGGGQNQYEIAKIVASQAAYTSPQIFFGYAPQYYWPAIDQDGTFAGINAAGPNDDFQHYVAACATAGVTARFVPHIGAFNIHNGGFSATGGLNSCIPAYIYYGSTATYGTPPVGASGAGWTYANWNGSIYGFIVPRFDYAATRDAWKSFWQHFANTPLTATSGPYAGQAFTWGTHPQVAMLMDWTDPDPDMNGNPTVPSNWNGGAWNSARANQAQTIAAALPQREFGLFSGFGANGLDALVAQQLLILQDQQAAGGAFSCTDVIFNGSAQQFTYAQSYLIGLKNTGPDPGQPNFVAGGTDFRPTMLIAPTVEGEDYGGASIFTSTPYTAQQVAGILNLAYNTLKAHVVFMGMDDARYGVVNGIQGPGAWSGTGAAASFYGSDGIAGAIATVGAGWNKVLPLSMMYGPAITSLMLNGSNKPVVDWSAITQQGSGLSILLFRDGAEIASGAAATFTTWTDSAATSGDHTYTLAMANANAPIGGPQGAGDSILVP